MSEPSSSPHHTPSAQPFGWCRSLSCRLPDVAAIKKWSLSWSVRRLFVSFCVCWMVVVVVELVLLYVEVGETSIQPKPRV